MRKSIPLYAAALAAALLVGCAGNAEVRATETLAIACDTIGTVLVQLSPMRAAGELEAETVHTITAILVATEPYCTPGSTVDPAAVVDFVSASAARLTAIFERGR